MENVLSTGCKSTIYVPRQLSVRELKEEVGRLAVIIIIRWIATL